MSTVWYHFWSTSIFKINIRTFAMWLGSFLSSKMTAPCWFWVATIFCWCCSPLTSNHNISYNRSTDELAWIQCWAFNTGLPCITSWRSLQKKIFSGLCHHQQRPAIALLLCILWQGGNYPKAGSQALHPMHVGSILFSRMSETGFQTSQKFMQGEFTKLVQRKMDMTNLILRFNFWFAGHQPSTRES